MGKTSTLQVVSSADEKKEKTQKKITGVINELTKLKEKIEKTGYLVEGGEKTAIAVGFWIENNASWKFTEAMGVIEATKQVRKAIEDIKKGKTKEFLLNNLSLEAIYYFVSKKEGKGLEEARNYYEGLLKPIADGLGRAKHDKDVVKDLEFKLASLENGIDVEENTVIVNEEPVTAK